MTTTPKIPDTRYFNLVELKKKWRIRTAKLSIRGEFDEVITKQRITMFFDFSKEEATIEEAEKDYIVEKQKNKNQLPDTDDETSMSSVVKKLWQRVEQLKQRLVLLKEQHKDFSFEAKVSEHKTKYSDWWISTDIVYQTEKRTIDRFDEFEQFLWSYNMIIVDLAEWYASQKVWMLDTIADEIWTKEFWWKVTVDWNDLKMLDSEKIYFDSLIRQVIAKNDAEQVKEIFDYRCKLFDWKIDDLKVILEWHRYDLERIKENEESERSILSIAIDEAKQISWMWKMMTLAAWFDFIEILKQYEK